MVRVRAVGASGTGLQGRFRGSDFPRECSKGRTFRVFWGTCFMDVFGARDVQPPWLTDVTGAVLQVVLGVVLYRRGLSGAVL
eukprot:7660339-Pyramimonas_sp.AAC.1